MRIAALYDVHGNLPALQAALADVRRASVDLVVVGGDVIPGPMPVECLRSLRDLDLPVRFIGGNGEREVLAHADGAGTTSLPGEVIEVMRWVAAEIPEAEREWIRGWPRDIELHVPGVGEVYFCHATPRNDHEIFLRTTPDDRLAPVFVGVDADVAVCGHTHMQFDRTVGGIRIVNAGSVGMPFGEVGAYWLLLGPDVELRRTPYDLEAAAARISATAYPQAEGFAENDVCNPRPEKEALDLLRAAELR